jgi:opacity protein-like surface antigen
MKKLLLSILLSAFFLGLSAQKGTSFFLGLQTQVGFPVGETIIENDEYIGFQSQRSFPEPADPDVLPINYGFGFQGGINIKNTLVLSTGLSYLLRKDQLALYCYVCDFITPPIPEKFELSIIQVPLNMQVNLNRNSKIFPFISGGVAWNHMFENGEVTSWAGQEGGFQFWSYSLGSGIGLRTAKNTEFLFRAQYNGDISDRATFPNFVFRDLSFAVGGVFKFSN